MSMFDGLGKPKVVKEGKSYDFAVKCSECGSLETEAYRSITESSIFNVFCEECGEEFSVRIPGV